MRRNLIIFALFLLIAAGVVASQFIFKWSGGTFLNPPPPLPITVLYSSELRSWLQPAADAFNREQHKVQGSPQGGAQAVQVTVEALDDGDAMRAIVSGSRTPTA